MVDIPILNVCPSILIVLTIEDAIPYNLLSTELIIAFVFGDENRANPKPRTIEQKTMNDIRLYFSFLQSSAG
jgi:hypothetical protein